MKRRTEIFLEIEEHYFELSGAKQIGWCDECACEVRLVSPEAGAMCSGLSTRLVYRRLETGLIHYSEKPDGSLRICLPSLMRSQR